MGGRKSKQKGNRVERKMVARLIEIGLVAKRVPLSGAAEGWKGDIDIQLSSGSVRAEVKGRKTCGWKTIKTWLGGNQLLFLVEDHCDPLVVMPWSMFQELVQPDGEDCGKGNYPEEDEPELGETDITSTPD